uniref:Uncharacterized protein n=1 Tax=Brugia malayi TaxID=6279 RepID=A0A5S6P9V9_BRUMA
MENMRDYLTALTITIVVCISLAIAIPILCFCICMLRFCYIARKQNKPEKFIRNAVISPAPARLPNSVNKAKSKSGTSQHFVTDRIHTDLSRSGRQIAKVQA